MTKQEELDLEDLTLEFDCHSCKHQNDCDYERQLKDLAGQVEQRIGNCYCPHEIFSFVMKCAEYVPI